MKKPIILLGGGVAVLTALLAVPHESSGQAGADDRQAIAQLVAEITDQHNKLAANQKAMDEKLAVIAENLRIARIYTARGGGAAAK